MNIRINDEYELRAFDSLNWALWGPVAKKDGTRGTGRLNVYFPSIGQALAYVWERGLLAEPGDMTLEQAVRRADEMRKSLLEVRR